MRKLSTKAQMLIPAFFLIFVAVALPTFITSGIFMNRTEKRAEEQCISDFHRSEDRILSLLSDVYYSSLNLWNDESVVTYFIDDYRTDREEIRRRVSLVRTLQTVVKPSSNTEAVVFFTSEGKIAGYSLYANYFDDSLSPVSLFETDTDLDHLIKWIGLIDSKTLLPYSHTEDDPDYFISGIKKQYYHLSGSAEKQAVYILFSVQKDALSNCFSYLEYDGSEVFLLDNNGIVLSGSAALGQTPDYYDKIKESDSSFVYSDDGKTQYHIIFYTMPTTGWTLVKRIPTATYKSTLYSLWRISAAVGITTFLLVFILYSIWVKSFTSPIRKLTSIISDIKNGNMDNRVELKSNYSTEMYLACEQFNSMLDSINELLEITENNERERAALEIKTLQSQITPHFIYNTISSIRYMASLSGAKNVEDALISFSNIIHPIFKTWQSDWTLSEELRLIENYISLMCMRFGTLFQIQEEINVPSNNYHVPRFLIQTLLENSCEHGFRGETAINIFLKIYTNEDFLYIVVEDDGNGIPVDKLKEIQDNISHGVITSNIGLANLDRRVKLYCGNDCGLSIESEYEHGTRISVKMRKI